MIHYCFSGHLDDYKYNYKEIKRKEIKEIFLLPGIRFC